MKARIPLGMEQGSQVKPVGGKSRTERRDENREKNRKIKDAKRKQEKYTSALMNASFRNETELYRDTVIPLIEKAIGGKSIEERLSILLTEYQREYSCESMHEVIVYFFEPYIKQALYEFLDSKYIERLREAIIPQSELENGDNGKKRNDNSKSGTNIITSLESAYMGEITDIKYVNKQFNNIITTGNRTVAKELKGFLRSTIGQYTIGDSSELIQNVRRYTQGYKKFKTGNSLLQSAFGSRDINIKFNSLEERDTFYKKYDELSRNIETIGTSKEKGYSELLNKYTTGNIDNNALCEIIVLAGRVKYIEGLERDFTDI